MHILDTGCLLLPPLALNFFHLMSQKGLLVKDGRILELLGKNDTLVFDKTGTLTENQPHLGKILWQIRGK